MWSIYLLENTVKIPKRCATALWKAQSYPGEMGWYYKDDVVTTAKVLSFNSDFNEHMDVLATFTDIEEILKTHKVLGTIKFGSLEGDNRGQFWGYQFDGKGGMRYLRGKLEWEPVP